jgi:hypothetical protein
MNEEIVHIGRRVKGIVDGKELDYWPSIDVAALTEDVRRDFLRRKNAVLLYIKGASYADIRAQCDIGANQIYRLITERCIAIHPDGR